MVIVIEVTEVVVVVVVVVMVFVRMVVMMVMKVVRWIVGRVHFRVGRRISGHHRGCGRLERSGRRRRRRSCRRCSRHSHGAHFAATCRRGSALVTHRLHTVRFGHLVVSAVRILYAHQITKRNKMTYALVNSVKTNWEKI